MLTDQTPTSAEDRRLLHAITLRGLLSFGPDTPALPLSNLNLLIGPNGSGKSNLIEALVLFAPHAVIYESL